MGLYIDESIQQKINISGTPADQYQLSGTLCRGVVFADSSGTIVEAFDTDATQTKRASCQATLDCAWRSDVSRPMRVSHLASRWQLHLPARKKELPSVAAVFPTCRS